MCDLIDLNSPDIRVSDSTKLASPLIPAPKNDESKSETSSSAVEKQENLGNNPFDRVLHETAEYISKKGDPFEMMLQRAMKFRSRRSTEHLKAQSVEFMDDFTPKRRKRYQKMMNKSLDVLDTFSLENKLGFNEDKKELEESADTIRAVICDNNATEDAFNTKQDCKILTTSPNLFESSLLNLSVMDDTLSDVCFNSKEISDISSENALFKKFIFPPTSYLKPLDMQRSLSHKVERSSIKSACLSKRSKSLTDGQKSLQRVNDTTSSLLDRAFLESKLSTFSSLSNVSSITKLTSTSTSLFSNDTMNHAFLDNDLLRTSHRQISTTENSEEIKVKQWDLSDLTERLNKLKCALNETSSVLNVTESESNSTKEGSIQISNDKLIDVDVFIPKQSTSKEYNKSSISTSSSDSAFTNVDKTHKSIIKEAKELARTFEELALKTDSSSNTNDDFISNNTLWMSELLPAFEDEAIVDNLIELPVSPEKSTEDSKNNNKEQSFTNIDNTDENSLKETSSEFSASNIKQTIVTSLLSDLKKIVKAEDNPEANKLLNNLEKALNVNCKNNTELLMTCLNISNELQSPQKTLSEDAERFGKTNTDKSEERNEKISDENICSNEKLSLDAANEKFGNISETITVNDNSLLVKSSSCKDNSENGLDINLPKDNTSCIEEKNNQMDEKLAIELLISLGKLLSGQTEDNVTTMQLLKNIGKALNIVSNSSSKIESEVQADRKVHNVQQTFAKASQSGHKSHSTKTAHRRSLQLESKSKPLEKTNRKSTSVTDSLSKSTFSTPIRKHKDTFEVDDRKKRLSSDHSNHPVNKKTTISEASNMRKAEAAQFDTKKKISIAMNDVKNKLKKKSEVINKKGPMRAVHPVDSMQRKRTLLGKHTLSSQSTTPPKVEKSTLSRGKIISSTPNSMDNDYIPKKPVKSKPVASSTPDSHNSKILDAQIMSANKKRNISCDISPVTAHVNTNSSDERKDSPKRPSKLPTPKKCTTPNRQQGIPRYSTPPKHNSSFNVSHQQSSKRLNRSLTDQQYSPVCQKKSSEKAQQSVFKESNRDNAKVKPYKLISKLRRHSISNLVEKENNYA